MTDWLPPHERIRKKLQEQAALNAQTSSPGNLDVTAQNIHAPGAEQTMIDRADAPALKSSKRVAFEEPLADEGSNARPVPTHTALENQNTVGASLPTYAAPDSYDSTGPFPTGAEPRTDMTIRPVEAPLESSCTLSALLENAPDHIWQEYDAEQPVDSTQDAFPPTPNSQNQRSCTHEPQNWPPDSTRCGTAKLKREIPHNEQSHTLESMPQRNEPFIAAPEPPSPSPVGVANDNPGRAIAPVNNGRGQNAPRRKGGWLRKKDIVQPERYDNDWGDEPPKEVDYNDISHLVDWDGNWKAAPVEWESRIAYRSQTFYRDISNWIEHAERAQGTTVIVTEVPSTISGKAKLKAIPQKPKINISHPGFTRECRRDGSIWPTLDIAPFSWVPKQIDDHTPFETWWVASEIMPPQAMDEEDLQNRVPFWHRYFDDGSPFQKPLSVPDPKLDPTDKHYVLAKMAPTSEDEVTKWMHEKEFGEEERRKAMKLAKKLSKMVVIVPPPPAPKPKLNIFLRYAKPQDVAQINDIYNWNVKNTCNVPEIGPRSHAHMLSRLQDISAACLPFIVAIDKAKSQRSRGWKGADHVVGFAYADDYHDPKEMWRFSVELEIFVHEQYYLRGIGEALMDRMLTLLDYTRGAKNMAQWFGREESSPERFIGSITAHIPFATEDIGRKALITAWLTKHGFTEKGCFEDFGIKKRQRTSLLIFFKKTGASIDPNTAYEDY